ncbi:KdsC family phosphatase [Olivibacter sitiensis]|uniref:KdsC family phosphatase n=1 Tax=Olivibacter sitiensis TaxID=376470 RepID=UPI0003FB3F3A|nr:HAD hydrolase-like protein [Olivibacter sitiensis]
MFSKFKQVKAFVFDVDGVLTNGDILVTEGGDQLRIFSTRDGYALQLAIKRRYPIAIITGGKSKGVKARLNGLGIEDVFIGVGDKELVLNDWLESKRLTMEDVLYMGDDIPDMEVMKQVGLATSPCDAVEEIKGLCQYISPVAGGRGAVRDVVEKVMKLQGTWTEDSSVKSN